LIFNVQYAIFFPYDTIIGGAMTNKDIRYGAVRSAGELGQLARAHRKNRKLTLETISGLANLSPRFLSEFERGKETAEIGKILKALRTLGLEVIIRPGGSTVHSSLVQEKGQMDD
jgi:HTH-type transcriptional regulator/antitoxin HipB